MANCVSVVIKIRPLFNFTISFHSKEPGKRHGVRAHYSEAVSDWLNALSLGTMSASVYTEKLFN